MQNDFLGVPWTSIYQSATFFRWCKKECPWEDSAILFGALDGFWCQPSLVKSSFHMIFIFAWSRCTSTKRLFGSKVMWSKSVPERKTASSLPANMNGIARREKLYFGSKRRRCNENQIVQKKCYIFELLFPTNSGHLGSNARYWWRTEAPKCSILYVFFNDLILITPFWAEM